MVTRLLLSALLLGGLSFLNTWDFPIYLFLVVVALAAGLGLRRGWAAVVQDWWRLALLALGLAVFSVALYFPFYLTFQSQAGGILPNLVWPTRFQQTFVFFGPVLVLAALYVGWLAWRGRRVLDRRAAWWAGGGIVGVLILLVIALSVTALASPALGAFIDNEIFPLTRDSALQLVLVHRLVDSLATIFPAVLIGLAVGLAVGILRRARPGATRSADLIEQAPEPAAAAVASEDTALERPWRRRRGVGGIAVRRDLGERRPVGGQTIITSPAVLMALAMILTGALLMLGPEWVYLRDNFGLRMNTLFKFYFQTWALWALAGAFGLWHLWQNAHRAGRWVAGSLAGLALAGSLVYTLPSLYSTWTGFTFGVEPTLNGMAFFEVRYPDELAAIQWLNANVEGQPVVAEAVGGAYQPDESRISMGTGLPTVMGWSNHEGQWRGDGYSLVAERPGAVERLYQIRDWAETLKILDDYGIEYVVVGNTERTRYNPVYEPKFDLYMDQVFEANTLTIYRRKPNQAP